jgi:hypothetical protein
MSPGNSGFNVLAVRGKTRLVLHRSLPDLPIALRIARELAVLRPIGLQGLFIADGASGATWSVTDLVDAQSGRIGGVAAAAARPDH